MKKQLWSIPLPVWISYLLLLTVATTGVTFAQFSTTAGSSDRARVAKFSMSAATVSGQKTDLKLDADNLSASYSFTVSSNSETAVTYNIIVTLPSALPKNVALELDDKTTTPRGNVYTFTGAGSFTPGNRTKTHKLEFSVPSDDQLEEDGTLNGITITVDAQQKD